MRCRTCNYVLWNTAERTCPECGESFNPREYEFVPGTVRFGCPECDHGYFGTSERGHLEPAEFECAECGTPIGIDVMVLRPAPEVASDDTAPGVMPWLEREHRGRLKSLIHTLGLALVRPGRLMRGVPANESAGPALVFGTLVTLLIYGVSGSATILMWFVGAGFMGGGMGGWFIMFYGALLLLLATCTTVSMLVIWPMLTHACLRMTGGTKYPIDRTIQAIGYSSGANVISAIPCAGIYVGWIWWMISAMFMVRAAHRVSRARAVFAVLCGPLSLLLVAVISYGAIFWISMSATMGMGGMGGPGGVGATPASQQTTQLVYGVLQYANQSEGAGPAHASELLLSGMAIWAYPQAGSAFLQPGTWTKAGDVAIASVTLDAFEERPRREQLRQILTAIDAQPDGVVAHRFGDFVFTYHGADLSTYDQRLWVAVMLPDPDVNGTPAATETIYVGHGSYQVTEITYAELAQATRNQNAVRAELNLPPLPDLMTVTHDQPGISAP